jgi:hypothetical protein
MEHLAVVVKKAVSLVTIPVLSNKLTSFFLVRK